MDNPFYQPPLIGRADDLDYLHKRLGSAGVTIIAAETMMGKGHLLDTFKNELIESGKYSVGYARGSIQNSLFKLCMADLYNRSIRELNYQQQFKQFKALVRARISPAIVNTVPVLKQLFGSQGQELQAYENLGNDIFNGLLDMRKHTLGTISQVDYLTAKELSHHLHTLNEKPQVLILYAFEQLSTPVQQGQLIEQWLRSNPNDNIEPPKWADMHIIIAICSPCNMTNTGEMEALQWSKRVRNLSRCEYKDLNHWQPAPQEWQHLFEYMQNEIPEFQQLVADAGALKEYCVLPGVIANCLYRQPKNHSELMQAQYDCINRTYQELTDHFDSFIQNPNAEHLSLLIELAAIQELTSEQQWQTLRDILFADRLDNIEALFRQGILRQLKPYPSFGHTTRYQHARSLIKQHWCYKAEGVLGDTVIKLFAGIQSMDNDNSDLLEAILSISFFSSPTSPMLNVVSGFAKTFTGQDVIPEYGALQQFVSTFGDQCKTGLSIALANMLAIDSDEYVQGGLLTVLNQLLNDNPDDLEIIKAWTLGLVNTSVGIESADDWECHYSTIKMLRKLSGAHPDDSTIQALLATSLFNALAYTGENRDPEFHQQLFDELRKLSNTHPGLEDVQIPFSHALVNALINMEGKKDLQHCHELLQELFCISDNHPYSAHLQTVLARGFFNTLGHAIEDDNFTQRDELLEQFYLLADRYKNNIEVQEWLAKGLYNAITSAIDEQNLDRLNSLWEKLQHLITTYPENDDIQQVFEKFKKLFDESDD